MLNWWSELPVVEQVFYMIAVPSTIILLIQTILLMFGMGHGGDADGDYGDMSGGHDGDVGHDAAEHVAGLRILSVRGIVAFLAVCGWVGIALLDLGVSLPVSLFFSIAAGLAAMVLVAFLIGLSMKLQQSGNVDMHNAVGVIGEVYLPISPDSKGKVTLVVQERFMEMDAICLTEPLKVGTRVRVEDVTESNVLIVSKV